MIAPGLRFIVVMLLTFAGPAVLAAQEESDSDPEPRRITALFGYGNALGWMGVQVERHSADERWSGFLGLGYIPSEGDGITGVSGAAGAIGVRGFTNGVRHRAFLELSFAQIATYATTPWAGSRHYGPGAQVGYQYVSNGGFSLIVSTGLGYAFGMLQGDRSWYGMGGLAVGYTWRGQG